jgi:hypothetical protein
MRALTTARTADGFEVDERLIAVIALGTDHLFDAVPASGTVTPIVVALAGVASPPIAIGDNVVRGIDRVDPKTAGKRQAWLTSPLRGHSWQKSTPTSGGLKSSFGSAAWMSIASTLRTTR